jgi:hypothetical protein
MSFVSFPIAADIVLSGFFGVAGFAQLLAFGFVRRSYQRWDFPPSFLRVAGAANLTAGCFLAIPNTRAWGVGIAAMITFVSVSMHLARGQYGWLLPGLVVMAALPPVLLTATV